MLETKLETALTENRKLQDKVADGQATFQEVKNELERKKAENVRLMASLNEAKAQLHFETSKVATVTEQLQAQISGLQEQIRQEKTKFDDAEQRIA